LREAAVALEDQAEDVAARGPKIHELGPRKAVDVQH